MYPTAATLTWPAATVVLVVIIVAFFAYAGFTDRRFKLQKAQITAEREEQLRQLVARYEQLAATTLDAQQRVAADVSELRSRATSIEKILSTVD